MSKIRVILAADPNGVIGVDGGMPWHYKADFKRFKAVTMGGALVMGRLTWESLPKPLPGRRMIVISRQENPASKHPAGSCEYHQSFESAMASAVNPPEGVELGDVWIAGGGEVYRIALTTHVEGVDEIDLTVVPAVDQEKLQKGTTVTTFDANLLDGFQLVSETINEEDGRLTHKRYERRT